MALVPYILVIVIFAIAAIPAVKDAAPQRRHEDELAAAVGQPPHRLW